MPITITKRGPVKQYPARVTVAISDAQQRAQVPEHRDSSTGRRTDR